MLFLSFGLHGVGCEAGSEGESGTAGHALRGWSGPLPCCLPRPEGPASLRQHEGQHNEISKEPRALWPGRGEGILPSATHGGLLSLMSWLPTAWAASQWHLLHTEQPPQRAVRDRGGGL